MNLQSVINYSRLFIQKNIFILFVGFEVFTAVVMKSIIFWDVTPCSLLSCISTKMILFILFICGLFNYDVSFSDSVA
jgi:hypothetical protein